MAGLPNTSSGQDHAVHLRLILVPAGIGNVCDVAAKIVVNVVLLLYEGNPDSLLGGVTSSPTTLMCRLAMSFGSSVVPSYSPEKTLLALGKDKCRYTRRVAYACISPLAK